MALRRAQTEAHNPGTEDSGLFDLALLSQCNQLIVTSSSSFGGLAAGMGGLHPYYVTPVCKSMLMTPMSPSHCFVLFKSGRVDVCIPLVLPCIARRHIAKCCTKNHFLASALQYLVQHFATCRRAIQGRKSGIQTFTCPDTSEQCRASPASTWAGGELSRRSRIE